MIKKEFKKFYAEYNKMNEDEASQEVEDFLEMMKQAFSKYPKIVFRDFGTFEVKETKVRKITDSRGNSEPIISKPRKYVKFKASKNLEERMKKK